MYGYAKTAGDGGKGGVRGGVGRRVEEEEGWGGGS